MARERSARNQIIEPRQRGVRVACGGINPIAQTREGGAAVESDSLLAQAARQWPIGPGRNGSATAAGSAGADFSSAKSWRWRAKESGNCAGNSGHLQSHWHHHTASRADLASRAENGNDFKIAFGSGADRPDRDC